MERIADVSARRIRPAAGVETVEHEGKLRLVRRRFGSFGRVVMRVFRVPPDYTVNLDGLGASVWRLVDGQRTVGDILTELHRQYPGEADLNGRLGRFVGQLVSRKMVVLD